MVGVQTVNRTAPVGTKGYEGVVTELDLRLTADHGGLPAGSEIQIGHVEVAVQTAPPPVPTTTTTPTRVPLPRFSSVLALTLVGVSRAVADARGAQAGNHLCGSDVRRDPA